MTSLVIGVLVRVVLIIAVYLGIFYWYEKYIAKDHSEAETSKALEL